MEAVSVKDGVVESRFREASEGVGLLWPALLIEGECLPTSAALEVAAEGF